MGKPDVLEAYGTTVGGLTPSSVLYAAEEDLRRRARNAQTKNGTVSNQFEHYAFLRLHVYRAKTPRDVLAKAIKHQDRGAESWKKGTRTIYRDLPVLRAALILAAEKYPDAGVNGS